MLYEIGQFSLIICQMKEIEFLVFTIKVSLIYGIDITNFPNKLHKLVNYLEYYVYAFMAINEPNSNMWIDSNMPY